MNIDTRKLFNSTIVHTALLAMSYFFIPSITQPLPTILQSIFPYLPFVIFILGMTLSWIFHHSREFNLFLLFTIIYIALDAYLWDADKKIDSQFIYLLIVALIPINYIFNFFYRERGIFNKYGLRQFIILLVQLYAIIWIIKHPSRVIKEYLNYTGLNISLPITTDISQPLILAITFAFLIIAFRLIQTASILLSGKLSSLIAITTAVHFYQQPQLATAFLLLAGLLLIISIIINSYSLAYLDELTNLPSRRALTQSISTLGKKYSIAMVDVDHFKKFNDKYGHDIGDQVLKKLASQLRLVRGGKAYRYGGEEFTLLFPGKNLHEAKLACEELCKKVANTPFMLRNKKRPKNKQTKSKLKKPLEAKPLSIKISIGIAERSPELPFADDIIKQADKALYKAKKNGRNQVAII